MRTWERAWSVVHASMGFVWLFGCIPYTDSSWEGTALGSCVWIGERWGLACLVGAKETLGEGRSLTCADGPGRYGSGGRREGGGVRRAEGGGHLRLYYELSMSVLESGGTGSRPRPMMLAQVACRVVQVRARSP